MLCKVLDRNGVELAPTKKEKAWYKVRKGKAKLISKEPMTIKLNKIVNKKKEGNIMEKNEENYIPLSIRAKKLTFSEKEDVEQYYKDQTGWGEARADYCFDKIHKILFKYYQNHLIDRKDKDFWCKYQQYYDLSKEEIEKNDIRDLKMLLWDLKGSYEFCTTFKNKIEHNDFYSYKDCYGYLNHYALMLYGAFLEQEEKRDKEKGHKEEKDYKGKVREIINTIKCKDNKFVSIDFKDFVADFSYNVDTDKFTGRATTYIPGTVGRIKDDSFSYSEEKLFEILLKVITDYKGEIEVRPITFGAISTEKIKAPEKFEKECKK